MDLLSLEQKTKSRNKTKKLPTGVLKKPRVKHLVAMKAPNCIIKRVNTTNMLWKTRTHMLEPYRNDKWYRQYFQLQIVNENKWKHAEGPQREHVATVAEREHWLNTHYLKQTSQGGTSTVATTKHLRVPKAKKRHQEHVRSQRTNTSTLSQSSSWQWQDWRSWESGKNSSTSAFPSPQNRKTPTLTYLAPRHRGRDVEQVLHDVSCVCR